MRKVLGALLAVLALAAVPAAGGSVDAGAPAATSYVVVFKQQNGLPADADRLVSAAGGVITVRLPEIGALGVESSNPDFVAAMESDSSVLAAGEDVEIGVPSHEELIGPDDAGNNGGTASPPGPDPQPGTEPLYHQQWDKMRVNASATGSYAVQRGQRAVTVAVLDTGVEVTHPDLVPNLDVARSMSFVPTEPYIDDENGHGSWCASAIAAPINAFGISGVAPNVTIVALKVLNRAGSGQGVWSAAALVYAGIQKFDVASMSFGGVRRHAQHSNAFYVLNHRAIQFARANGVTPVASAGNSNLDLSDGELNRDVIRYPVEFSGVIGVSATGYYNRRSFYSNYGVGKIDVAAPGGDSRQLPPPPYAGRGRVLGAWAVETAHTVVDSETQCEPDGGCHFYAYIQGTSMAAPHASGVAALIISHYGGPRPNDPWYMSPQHVESILQTTANNQPCPEPSDTCQGDTGYNSWYGKGIVDALKAVTFQPPQPAGGY